MDGPAGRRRLASETLEFAVNLTPCPARVPYRVGFRAE